MKEYIILEIIPDRIKDGNIIQLEALKIKDLKLIDRLDIRLNEELIPLDSLKELVSYDKDKFIYKNTKKEIINEFKEFINDIPLLILNNEYTNNYLEEIENEKIDITKLLNTNYSDDLIDRIITKYKLQPSNYIVDLLYEALMFENDNNLWYIIKAVEMIIWV